MFASVSRYLRSCLLVTLLMPGVTALAQGGEWIAAGSIVATIDGVEQTTHAYDVHAPGSTTVTFAPGATFMYMEPMMMGDVVLVPAYYHVSVLTYDIELENNQQGAIELNV